MISLAVKTARLIFCPNYVTVENMSIFPRCFLLLSIAAVTLNVAPSNAQSNTVAPLNPKELDRYHLAADYSKQFKGLSVLIMRGGQVVFEEYQNGHNANKAHMLASGTKSFNGIIAAAAVEDGLLKFDDKVSDTITEWKGDELKSKITIRELLSLISGIEPGDNGRPPAYAEAIKLKAKYEPEEYFEYGPASFQVFGELMRRKLLVKNETPLDYLKRRVLNPIGLKVAYWNHQQGQTNMPSGAYLTTREWAKYGQFLLQKGKWDGQQLISEKLLAECFKGSKTNPNYGLTFWLNKANDGEAKVAPKPAGRGRLLDLLGIGAETTIISQQGFGKNLPHDIIVAAGAGKQRLYVIPSLDMVVVRQADQARFEDDEFLSRLLLGKPAE